MKFDHIFLDFDETLFSHLTFIDWLDAFFSRQYGLKPDTFKQTLWQHHDYLPEGLRLYQHLTHFEEATGRSWAFLSGEVERELRAAELDFCYPDAHVVIKTLLAQHADVRILTFGNGEYQRFKLYTCQLIRSSSIPIHVVSEPKRKFLAREFAAGTGVLVDDKHPQDLPANWQEIWINRQEKIEEPVRHPSGVVQVDSLLQLLPVLGLQAIKNIDKQ